MKFFPIVVVVRSGAAVNEIIQNHPFEIAGYETSIEVVSVVTINDAIVPMTYVADKFNSIDGMAFFFSEETLALQFKLKWA